jgi:hypothetical protein
LQIVSVTHSAVPPTELILISPEAQAVLEGATGLVEVDKDVVFNDVVEDVLEVEDPTAGGVEPEPIAAEDGRVLAIADDDWLTVELQPDAGKLINA